MHLLFPGCIYYFQNILKFWTLQFKKYRGVVEIIDRIAT